MTDRKKIGEIIRKTRVIRFPKHRLATFGESDIPYNLVTSLGASSNLRVGRVTAARPKIITPQAILSRYQGFGEEVEEVARLLNDFLGDSFRGLEYVFHNKLERTDSHALGAAELARNIKRDLDRQETSRSALICGPEVGWQLSLLKFIAEETSQSFVSNVRELEERGMFDPAQAVIHRRRREIEALFRQAGTDRSKLKALAERLKSSGLFAEYQDRFFSLVDR